MKNYFFAFFLCVAYGLLLIPAVVPAQAISKRTIRKAKLLMQEEFSQPLDSVIWKTEIELPGSSLVAVKNGQLIIDTKGGATVWLNKQLRGNILIEYDWTVLMDSGINDRVSDMNQFWMATDLQNKNLFTRNGAFASYDSLQLYYVGIGGNGNTTTRFRKYDGAGNRQLLAAFTDSSHLLKANQTYHIRIVVKDAATWMEVNGIRFFTYTDTAPLTSGYFGFRSTWSRHAIDHFKIVQLLK